MSLFQLFTRSSHSISEQRRLAGSAKLQSNKVRILDDCFGGGNIPRTDKLMQGSIAGKRQDTREGD